MTVSFASNKRAIAECDICGFRFKLKELRNIITRGRDTNIKACPECFSPDPQAIRDPRPDFAGYPSSRNTQWGWDPVGDGKNIYGLRVSRLQAVSAVGEVTVTT